MSTIKINSLLRSFIVVPMLATGLSLSAFTASVDQFVTLQTSSDQSAQTNLSPEEVKLQVEREERAAKIDAYFTKNKMPLAGHGMDMVLAAEKYDLDWRIIPAMAARESTGGKFACKKYPENAWGWHSCKAGLGGSTENAIELIAQHISGSHPNTKRYYENKTSPKEILQVYNPPSVVPTYAHEVIAIMDKIEAIHI
jgi:hypothetical protein